MAARRGAGGAPPRISHCIYSTNCLTDLPAPVLPDPPQGTTLATPACPNELKGADGGEMGEVTTPAELPGSAQTIKPCTGEGRLPDR